MKSHLRWAATGCLVLMLGGCGDETGEDDEKIRFENSESLCSDGVDNDGDGATDCADLECAEFDICKRGWEAPEDWNVERTGKKLVENFAGRSLGSGEMHYAQVCTWYGALTVADRMGEDELVTQLIERFEPILTEEGAEEYIPTRAHVDDRIFGIVPLEIYLQNGDASYYDMGIAFADKQWENPRADGMTRDARWWIDDMYMITILQVQAYRAALAKEVEADAYRERAALAMAAYLDKLQQDTGLFFHTPASPWYWGRGNGWFAAGMAEMLSVMSEEDEHHDRIMEGYKDMMAALRDYQNDEGLWNQLIDDEEAWTETSGSAMFTFAMVVGAQNRWLDKDEYGPVIEAAWPALTSYLTTTGNLTDVCVGTGDADSQGYSKDDLDAQRQYYLDRPVQTGDYHGQAPMLWTAAALLRGE